MGTLIRTQEKKKVPDKPKVGRHRWAYRTLGCLVLIVALGGSVLVFNFVSDWGSHTFGLKKVSFLPREETTRTGKEVGSAIGHLFTKSLDVENQKKAPAVYKDPSAVLGSGRPADRANAAKLRDLLKNDPVFSGCKIAVGVEGNRATLTGMVNQAALIKKAEQAVLRTGIVKWVANTLVVTK